MRTVIKPKQAKHNPRKEFIINNHQKTAAILSETPNELLVSKGVTSEERNQLIAEAAYFRAEHRSFAPGHELEDWLTAEAEIEGRLLKTSALDLTKHV